MGNGTVLKRALTSVPTPIASALAREYGKLEARYSRRDWSPAELNGGRFAEAVLRYLEWKSTGQYTSMDGRLDRSKITSTVKQDTSLPEGIRFHVRRCADLLMDVRNKRDVAHLGEQIDFYEMDTHLVMRLAAWSLSEILREEAGLASSQIQALIDRMSATHFPLVEELDGELVVVATHLPAGEQALVGLLHSYPDALSMDELFAAIQYQNKSRFKSLVEEHAKHGRVHINGGNARLTEKGVAWTEENVDLEFRLS